MSITFILTRIALALAIVAGGQVLGTWLSGVARYALARTGMAPEVRRLVANAIQPLILVAAVLAALPFLGVDPTSLVAVLGASTLAIGMALRSSLSNIASGAILLTLRPIREGESVKVSGVDGTLESLEIYATTLRTADGQLVTIANDTVMKSPIVNYSRMGVRRADVEFLIAPDAKKIATALGELRAVVEGHEKVLADPAPSVSIARQQPGAIVLVARAHVNAADFGAVKVDVLTSGLEALAKAKVQLATVSQGS